MQRFFEVTAKLQLKCTKMKKFPVHWRSKVPVRYECNAVLGELHRAKKIACNSKIEIRRIVNNMQ